MIAEPHVPGTEFGELQLAIWTREFQKLRDGDRFFYGNDQGLTYIQQHLRHRLPHAPWRRSSPTTPTSRGGPERERVPGAGRRRPARHDVHGHYTVTPADDGTFRTALHITNTGSTATAKWTLGCQFASGQRVRTDARAGNVSSADNEQSDRDRRAIEPRPGRCSGTDQLHRQLGIMPPRQTAEHHPQRTTAAP